jgi:integrase
VQIGSVLKPDVTAWVVQMERAGIGAATIQGSVGVLRGLFELAVDARLVRVNPARGVRMPKRNTHVDRVLSTDEDELLLESLDRQFPGRPDARLFVEVMLYCGLRYEECAAICRTHLDMRRQLIHVGPVLERDGTIRPYPKSPAGERSVPVPEDIWVRLRDHALTVRPGCCTDDPPGGLLFTSSRGCVLHYSTWLRRVWQRGLYPVEQRGKRGTVLVSGQVLENPQPTPHDLRHTYGTRLGDAGLGIHDIMSLMGHETLESAQRYLHAGEDRFDRAREALKRVRGM